MLPKSRRCCANFTCVKIHIKYALTMPSSGFMWLQHRVAYEPHPNLNVPTRIQIQVICGEKNVMWKKTD